MGLNIDKTYHMLKIIDLIYEVTPATFVHQK